MSPTDGDSEPTNEDSGINWDKWKPGFDWHKWTKSWEDNDDQQFSS